MNKPEESRRDFVKKTMYVAPAIVTLSATPAFAKTGSAKHDNTNNPGQPGHPLGGPPGRR